MRASVHVVMPAYMQDERYVMCDKRERERERSWRNERTIALKLLFCHSHPTLLLSRSHQTSSFSHHISLMHAISLICLYWGVAIGALIMCIACGYWRAMHFCLMFVWCCACRVNCSGAPLDPPLRSLLWNLNWTNLGPSPYCDTCLSGISPFAFVYMLFLPEHYL